MAAKLIVVEGNFADCLVSVDNFHFRRCRFERVQFVYSGGPYAAEDCYVSPDCRLELNESAALTVNLLKTMRRYGLVEMPLDWGKVQ